MPFTLSHPAASVPFIRWGLVPSALIIGSMSPDFMYFITISSTAFFGHTLTGVFLFCLPAGLAVLWIFHTFLKRPLLSLLPVAHQERLILVSNGFTFRPLSRFILIVLSLLLGAFTHILWDSFTHFDGHAVRLFPFLNLSMALGPLSVKVYNILQYVSTFIGAYLLYLWYVRWFRKAPKHPISSVYKLSASMKSAVLLAIVPGAFLLAYIFGAAGRVTVISDFHALRTFLVVRIIIFGISIASIELTVFAFLWHLLMSRKEVALR
jgi:hypothetical protein